jgi:uncharacterized protein YciI
VAEWIVFLHAPRDRFAETLTDDEAAIMGAHFERLQRLHAEGSIVLVGPTLGPVNTGVAVFEAEDEAAAQRFVDEDPSVSSGLLEAELRPFRVALLRGRD